MVSNWEDEYVVGSQTAFRQSNVTLQIQQDNLKPVQFKLVQHNLNLNSNSTKDMNFFNQFILLLEVYYVCDILYR